MQNEILKTIQNPKNLLSETVENIAAGIVSITSIDRGNLILSASHLVKTMIKGKFLDGLNEEWQKHVSEGRIKLDYKFNPEHYNTLAEMLEYLDNGVPNDKVFDVMKKIFFTSIIEKNVDDQSILPYQFLQITKKLSSAEILVLITIREMHLKGEFETEPNNFSSIQVFFGIIAQKTGLIYKELLELTMDSLCAKKLLPPSFSSNPALRVGNNKEKEPTVLGKAFCEYIEKYDELTKPLA